MLTHTNAIILSKIRYKDNDLIVKCYTEELGVVSFLVRGALKSKKGASKAAYFQLLCQLQLVIAYKNNKNLHSIKEVKPNYIYSSLHSNILKGAVVMFLSEILASILQEEEENRILYSYIETALLWFDAQTKSSNFHLLFLLNLSKYLGFYPELENVNSSFFNLKDGRFEDQSMGKYAIQGENLVLLKTLLGTKFDGLDTIKINASQRQSFLNMILLYFELHLGSFKTPRSIKVFNQVFR